MISKCDELAQSLHECIDKSEELAQNMRESIDNRGDVDVWMMQMHKCYKRSGECDSDSDCSGRSDDKKSCDSRVR